MRRRYQDFDWLRNKLEESQPTHLIPVGSSPGPLVTEPLLFCFRKHTSSGFITIMDSRLCVCSWENAMHTFQ